MIKQVKMTTEMNKCADFTFLQNSNQLPEVTVVIGTVSQACSLTWMSGSTNSNTGVLPLTGLSGDTTKEDNIQNTVV